MPNDLPKVWPQSNLGSTINKVINHAAANNMTSKDLKFQKGSYGTVVKVADELKRFPTAFTNYCGEYDPDAQYSVNDVVRVMPNTNYFNTGAETTMDTTPGVWICIAEVPGFQTSEVMKSRGFTSGDFIRYDGVDYFPKWPEPQYTLQDVVNGVTNDRYHIRYWELISLLPVQATMCVNGVDKTYWVDCAQSGSVVTQ